MVQKKIERCIKKGLWYIKKHVHIFVKKKRTGVRKKRVHIFIIYIVQKFNINILIFYTYNEKIYLPYKKLSLAPKNSVVDF